jgi:hypothetical protein
MTGCGGKIHAGRLCRQRHVFVAFRRDKAREQKIRYRRSRVEHVHASESCNSERRRISGPTSVGGLGLGPVGNATKTSHLGLKHVPARLRSCYRVGHACSFGYRVCSGSPLSILRSSPSSNICRGSVAFYCWNRFWNRRCLATEFITLARPRFRSVHACVLDNDGIGRMNP